MKSHIYRVPGASKVKSHFPAYFSIEDSQPKFFFAIVSTSTKKYFKKKKVLKNMFSLGKKIDFFVFSWTNFICYLKKVIRPSYSPISFPILFGYFLLFSMAILIILREKNFNLGLYSINFLISKVEFYFSTVVF